MNAVLQKPRAKTSSGASSASDLASAHGRYFALRTSQFDLRRRRRNFALRTSQFDLRRTRRPFALRPSPFALRRNRAATVLDSDFSSDGHGASDVENPYTFTGRRWDAESGLMQYRHRYYGPALGRFVTRDPLLYGNGIWNLYPWPMHSPNSVGDPFGLGPWAWILTGEWNPDANVLNAASRGWVQGLGQIPGTNASLGQKLYTGKWSASDTEIDAAVEGARQGLRQGVWAVLPSTVKNGIHDYLECCDKGQGKSDILYLSCSVGGAAGGGGVGEFGLEAHVICDSGEVAIYGYAGIGGAQIYDLGISCIGGKGWGFGGIHHSGDYEGGFAAFGASGSINSPGGLGVAAGAAYSTNMHGVSSGRIGGGLSFGIPGPGVITYEQAQGYARLFSFTAPPD